MKSGVIFRKTKRQRANIKCLTQINKGYEKNAPQIVTFNAWKNLPYIQEISLFHTKIVNLFFATMHVICTNTHILKITSAEELKFFQKSSFLNLY
jgi:hypothetical protein